MENKFNFFVDADINILKANKKIKRGSEEWYNNMVIKGQASSDDEDSDGETLEPNGYVISKFLKEGYLNYEHLTKDKASYQIGEPTDAIIKDNKFLIKGKLWSKSPRARDLWDTLHVMKDSKSTRKVGFSIEGKALQRDPMNEKRITKALITNVAITFNPKNSNTWLDLVKGEQDKDFIEYNDDANGGKIYLLDITTPKGIRVTIDKDFNIKMDKAMTTDSARALIPESLDGKLTDLKNNTFRKNIEVIANYHKIIGFNDEDLKKIKKNIKNYF